ncbi:MAG: type II toxin-antitoxin system Phd/YefM family antitoxin [Acidimicrobiales bacterium]
MKQVKIAQLKDQLSKHLRDVEQGGEVEVMDRNRPIARLVPVPPDDGSVRIVAARLPFTNIRDRRYPPANWPCRSLELLLEERGSR